MEKEESILFPMLERGGTPFVFHPIGVMRTEHEEHAERLQYSITLTTGRHAASGRQQGLAAPLLRRQVAFRRPAAAHSP
ncbi:MAG: hypothetical protein HC793_00630 [Aquincola sp.]|nr:hypothetical protein [Aquincola sp.]